MTVKIEGMEMPRYCAGCKLNFYDRAFKKYVCLPADSTLTDEEFYAETRPSWCPLQGVKECL